MTLERIADGEALPPAATVVQARLLRRRLRVGLLASMVAIAAFGIADVTLFPQALRGLLVVKAAQLVIVAAGLRVLATDQSRHAPRLIGAVIVSAIYATAAAAGILRGDVTTTSWFLLGGVMTSAVILPWGPLTQLGTVLMATAALLATALTTPDGLITVTGHRALTIVLVFTGSIAAAAEHARHRRHRDQVAAVLTGHTRVLEQITSGVPLADILCAVVTMVERHADGMMCSVLLLDGDRLRHGAAPSLPRTYIDAIDGLIIGPDVGSCGSAAYGRTLVIVPDVSRDARWAPFRDAALAHGLRACWSAPILASDGACLGTLAMYYHEARPPDADELELIESAAHLAAVAIERRRNEDALAASRRQLEDESHVAQALVHAGEVMLGSPDTPLVLARISRLVTELLGCDCADTVVRHVDEDVYITGSAYGYAADESAALERTRMPAAMLAPLLATLAERGLVQVRTAAVTEPEIAALLRAYGITNSLYVALRRGTQLIGFLSAGYRRREARFTDRQRRIALGIAQLASMALENARLVEEATRASQLKSEFVSTMSHELRTPLNVVIGYTDMLADDVAPAQRLEILSKIRGSSIELLEMIEATLNLNRLEAGKDRPHIERLSIDVVLDELAEEFAALPRRAETVLRWEPAPPLNVYSDRRKLRIILKNLIGNALKFTPQGEVVICCLAAEDGCVITVRDTGVGISREQLPVIFEMFRQGDSSDARSYGGVGLGLYIVRRLLTQLGGDVTVESEPGRGTTFAVTLPSLDETTLRATA